MPAPPNYVFTIFAFVSFFLCLIKVPTQLHAWNVGTLLFLVWVGLSCLSLGINSIVWNHNTVDWAPVWCDISSRFNVGISVAIPAVVICINRRLYLLACPTISSFSKVDKRREIMIDLAIGVGLPVLDMILFFFPQGSRYLIFEDYGCAPSPFGTWLAVFFLDILPLLLEIIAGVYGCLAIRAFYKRRSHMNQLLTGHRNLSSSRYIRLMCFSFCDLLFGIPITTLYLYLSILSKPVPFPGLKQAHFHFSQVIQIPAAEWRATPLGEMSWELNRWLSVWVAFVFFAIFGLTQDSRDYYRAALRPVVQVMTSRIKNRSGSSNLDTITFKNTTSTLATDSTVKIDVESTAYSSTILSIK